MQLGQADGVQCRTVEVFESFGIAEGLLQTAYHVLEVAFWSSDSSGNLVRTGRTADTIPGLSHQPHVILNQASVNGFLLDAMNRFNSQTVDYGYTVTGVHVDSSSCKQTNDTPSAPNGSSVLVKDSSYPVTVVTEKSGVQDTFKARHVLVSQSEMKDGCCLPIIGL
jgi:phenol 2-monooxygenase